MKVRRHEDLPRKKARRARGERQSVVDRIVFMTGGSFTPAGLSFLDSVPNLRLEKPFTLDPLQALVRSLVR